MKNVSDIRQQIETHTAAIRRAAVRRQRIVDRIDAVRDEPEETDENYRKSQVAHQEARLRDYTDQLREAESEVLRVAGEAVAFARSVSAETTGATAVDLSGDDWVRAGAVSALLEAELVDAQPDAIASRLEGAALTGARPERYAVALIAERMLANAIPRDEGDRRRISVARQLIADIRTSLRPPTLAALHEEARQLMGTAAQAETDVAEGRRERGEGQFQMARGGRTVKLAGSDESGWRMG